MKLFNFLISSSFTVGLEVDKDISISLIVTIGSNNLVPSTCSQVISMPAGSPGEHGVYRSSTTTSGLLGNGPLTYLIKERILILVN